VPKSLRLPIAAVVAAVLVAEAAVLVLRPRDTGPTPLPVDAASYFSGAQIAKAEAFRDGQFVLYVADVAVGLAVLALLVARPPRALRRDHRRPVLAGAAAGAAVSLALGVAGLPVAAIARERAMDVGLVTQSWGGWAGDVVRSQGISAAIAGAGGALLVFGIRRFGRRWWIPGAAVVVAYAVAITYAAPVLLEPVFNRFTPLPQGELRAEVLELAARADVDVGEVYSVDASRRVTSANAYVAGLGATKRVVLYDNLLRDFEPAEIRSVVAHELGHVHHRDVPTGLLWVALVAPVGMWAVARVADRAGARGDAAAVPAVALAIAIVVPAVTMVSNQMSRGVERRADAFALELTRDPDALVGLQTRLAGRNLSDPDPPAWRSGLLGTHPTAVQRIGQAEAFRAERR
jgi:STE24 endopeptidase